MPNPISIALKIAASTLRPNYSAIRATYDRIWTASPNLGT
jgi:hypothetical protein